jgi:mycothiol synthase
MIGLVEIAAPPVPGLGFRHYRGPEDHPAMLRVYSAAHEADGIDEVTTLRDFGLNYSTLVNCDPARDIVLAAVDGELVAYARVFWQDLVEGGRSYECFGFVHPAWRRRGIGGALFRHNEQRLREIAAGHPGVQPKWLASEGIDADAGNHAMLTGAGYEAVRWFYDMVAPTLEGIVAPPLPRASTCARRRGTNIGGSGRRRRRPSGTTGARRSGPRRIGHASTRTRHTRTHASGASRGTATRSPA